MLCNPEETEILLKGGFAEYSKDGSLKHTNKGRLACHWPSHEKYKGDLKTAVRPFIEKLDQNPESLRSQIKDCIAEGFPKSVAPTAAAAKFITTASKILHLFPNNRILHAYREYLKKNPSGSLDVTQNVLGRFHNKTEQPAPQMG
jgi:hypothetical protein